MRFGKALLSVASWPLGTRHLDAATILKRRTDMNATERHHLEYSNIGTRETDGEGPSAWPPPREESKSRTWWLDYACRSAPVLKGSRSASSEKSEHRPVVGRTAPGNHPNSSPSSGYPRTQIRIHPIDGIDVTKSNWTTSLSPSHHQTRPLPLSGTIRSNLTPSTNTKTRNCEPAMAPRPLHPPNPSTPGRSGTAHGAPLQVRNTPALQGKRKRPGTNTTSTCSARSPPRSAKAGSTLSRARAS